MFKPDANTLPIHISIFYSTTYTTIYVICICFLAITPISMMWQAIENLALQYVIMIGGTYVLTASIAIFIFASRLFTNRTVMAGMGKAYIPVEPGYFLLMRVGSGSECISIVRHPLRKRLTGSA